MALPSSSYRSALDAACREWEALAADRAALDRRLLDLHRTIVTLTRLCGLTPTVPLGLADGCRLVLRRQGDRAISAREVREELALIGVDLSQLSNPLASIHVTLKRLVAAGEARFIPGGGGASPLYAPIAPARSTEARNGTLVRGGAAAVVGTASPRPRGSRTRKKS